MNPLSARCKRKKKHPSGGNRIISSISSSQTPRKGNNLKVKGLWKKNARDVSYVPSRGFLMSVLFLSNAAAKDITL